MQLHERLMDLIGHEVSVSAHLESKLEGTSRGIVKEVGPDFLMLGAKDGRSNWWVRMEAVAAIVHDSTCPRCSQGPAV